MSSVAAGADDPSGGGPEAADDPALTSDEAFEVLRNRRRRYVLHYLLQRDERVDLRGLTVQLSAWENDVPAAEVTHKQRKRVYTALRQTHLPQMDRAGVVDYDGARGEIEATPAARDLDVYLDVVAGSELPWSELYLGLGLFSLALVAAAWVVPFPPFSLLPGLGWAAVVAGLFTVTAAVDRYVDGRRRLGSDGPPPELREG